MNILFFCRRFWPLVGGVEKHCLFVGRELVRRGDKLSLVTEWEMSNDRAYIAYEKVQGIDVYRIPITKGESQKKFAIWGWLLKNRRLIRSADLVHCHDVFYWFCPFKLITPNKRVFTTFHGYEGNQPPTSNKILQHQLAAGLSFGSMAIGDYHQKWYRVKADVVSYGAVSLPVIGQSSSRPRYDYCYIGRLAADTGIMTYLRALNLLKRIQPGSSLVVCGDGPQMAEARDYVDSHRLSVAFMGFVEDPLEYLAQSKTAFVSRYLAILEAMALEKPVIAVYDNPIKYDYLSLAPFAKWISLAKTPKQLLKILSAKPDQGKILQANEWARQQSWASLVDCYLTLWGLKKPV